MDNEKITPPPTQAELPFDGLDLLAGLDAATKPRRKVSREMAKPKEASDAELFEAERLGAMSAARAVNGLMRIRTGRVARRFGTPGIEAGKKNIASRNRQQRRNLRMIRWQSGHIH